MALSLSCEVNPPPPSLWLESTLCTIPIFLKILPSCLSDNLEFYTQPIFFLQFLKTFSTSWSCWDIGSFCNSLSFVCDLFSPFSSDSLLAVIVYSVLRFHNDIPSCGSVLRPRYLLGSFSMTAHILQLWEFFLTYITWVCPIWFLHSFFLKPLLNFWTFWICPVILFFPPITLHLFVLLPRRFSYL